MKTKTIDPVCGMEVDADSPHYASREGETIHFCSAKCRDKFVADPGSFTDKDEENDGGPNESGPKKREKDRGSTWRDYIPLMVIFALTILAACAKQIAYGGEWQWSGWMHDFMGFFLVVFSMFKFFNMEGFADGFQMYDLLAKPFRPYAFVYPFIECGLGLGYLSHWNPVFIYASTVAVMLFGSLGVIRALMKGLDIHCACMGSVLNVPLSTVALVEDLGMAAMAGAMWVMAA